MESGFTSKDTYLSHFNPRDYLEKYYSFGSRHCAENEILRHLLKNLFKIFCLDGVKGELLIDIGSGPTIYQLLSACESFTEIIVTDYTDQNLWELQKWLKKEPGAFDWSPVVTYVCDLEGNRTGQQPWNKSPYLRDNSCSTLPSMGRSSQCRRSQQRRFLNEENPRQIRTKWLP
nr:nicotinamide N-methyltransferase isoform X3 [Rattus norvegicus]